MKVKERAKELLEEFKAECREVSLECMKEGFPSGGSNYDLRCENIWNRSYAEEYQELLERDEEEEL